MTKRRINLKKIRSLIYYYEDTPIKIPFPAHTNYEGKAYEYLVNNIDKLKQPVLFWNIGS